MKNIITDKKLETAKGLSKEIIEMAKRFINDNIGTDYEFPPSYFIIRINENHVLTVPQEVKLEELFYNKIKEICKEIIADYVLFIIEGYIDTIEIIIKNKETEKMYKDIKDNTLNKRCLVIQLTDKYGITTSKLIIIKEENNKIKFDDTDIDWHEGESSNNIKPWEEIPSHQLN